MTCSDQRLANREDHRETTYFSMSTLTKIRDLSGREWLLAPEPPSELDGILQYGFVVSAEAVAAVVQEYFEGKERSFEDTYYAFWTACRCAMQNPESRPLYKGVRRDIQLVKVPGHPLYGMVIGIASNGSQMTRIMPRQDDIARLKKVLCTDAEPEWIPVRSYSASSS